ncbi:hypothetical protein JHK84_037107 [Glycine max]|nr:hypothetical protein JHK84_037107 [Glycine max]
MKGRSDGDEHLMLARMVNSNYFSFFLHGLLLLSLNSSFFSLSFLVFNGGENECRERFSVGLCCVAVGCKLWVGTGFSVFTVPLSFRAQFSFRFAARKTTSFLHFGVASYSEAIYYKMRRMKKDIEDEVLPNDMSGAQLNDESYEGKVSLHALQESQHSQSTGGLNGGDKMHPDFLQKNSYEIHDAIFDSLKDNQGILPYVHELSDISVYGNKLKGLDSSQYCSFVPPTSPKRKRLKESTIPFIDSCAMKKKDLYPFDQIQDNNSDKIAQSFGMQAPLDPGLSSHSSMCYSHSLSNGNSSTSKPYEAMKLELPSLQYPELDLGSWGSSPPPSLLESVDDFLQSPTAISTLESDCSSPQNSGLLDALLYQAKTMSSSKNHCSDKSSNSSTATPGDRADSSILNVYETEWEDYADPVSPFGATSILNECPALRANANSLNGQLPVQTFTGNLPKLESVDQVWTPNNENLTLSLLNITRPDFLLASDWYDLGSGHCKNQTITTDAATAFLGDDLATDLKHMTAGISKTMFENPFQPL